ncbi:MAG: deoxyribonuclease IV [Verrucomicrobiae bacterium]|nr:deoxyribonuclease IV [Verrucomicrobiae bacterium]
MLDQKQAVPRLGAHMSIAGGVHFAIERGRAIGCEAIQIFLKNATRWKTKALSDQEVELFRAARAGMPVVAHAGYLLNLGVSNPRSVTALADEIRRAERLGIEWIVLHPGCHLGAGEVAGLKTVAENLDAAFCATQASRVGIALETTAGQGTSLGHRLEHLAAIIGASRHPNRLATCLDTCHLFAAGYDIRTQRGYEAVMLELDTVIGLRRVVVIHLNDSLRALGSRVDRHQHVGKGWLGLETFRRFLRDERWQGLPMVLETPKGKTMREDIENLQTLRSLL